MKAGTKKTTAIARIGILLLVHDGYRLPHRVDEGHGNCWRWSSDWHVCWVLDRGGWRGAGANLHRGLSEDVLKTKRTTM